ncbi:MAG: winged helix-turn-helix transcriptional regulator [archaeon]|nr:winged helix-turn-helix transcriptional regulator [archaeon]
MLKLDSYDRKILESLLINSRENVSAIGKRVTLRRENVNYKINRLIKIGLIKEFNAVLDEKRMKLIHYVVFLELTNLQENSEKEILEYLKESKYGSWVGTCAGKWSLIFDIIISESSELDKTIKDFFSQFSEFIGEYVILRLQEGNYFGFKILGMLEKKVQNFELKHKIKFDKKDLEILSMLNKNSRASLVEISEKVALTPNGVNNRIKNLENMGIITNYTISLDWKKLGYEWFGLQLKLTKFGETTDKKLSEYFEKHKKIVFYYKYLGGAWDYDIGIIAQDSNELRLFIHEFRRNFSDTVKISDIFLTLEETTGYILPKGVFENYQI